MSYLEENSVDIAVLQETWLNKGDKNILAEISEYGYNVYKSSRQSKANGGGVAILGKSSINISPIELGRYKTFESISCNVKLKDAIIKLSNIYRLPYSQQHRYTASMFNDEFEQYLDKYLDLPGHNMICGDFNLHVENTHDRQSLLFLDLIQMNNLTQLIDVPTHSHGGTLDLVISDNFSVLPLENISVDTDFDASDHYPISFDILCEIPNT